MQLAAPPIFQLKTSAEGIVQGVASSFGRVDSYGDTVMPGAYLASLSEHQAAGTKPAMLWSHRMAEPIGRWTSMNEGADGLHVAGQLNMRSDRGAQAFAHLHAGDVSGLSVGYTIPKNGAEFRGEVRLLKSIALLEVSLVTLPADAGARVSSVKSEDDMPQTLREFERVLHSIGFSKTRAALLAKKGWTADEPDPDEPLDLPKLQAIAAQLHSFTTALKGRTS